MKKVIIFVLNILILAVLGVLLRTIIMGKIALYLRYIREYGDYYPLKLDFELFLVTAIFLSLLNKILFQLCFKNTSVFNQALITGLVGVLIVYLFGAFFNGFVVTFSLTTESIKLLTPIFIIGFILPFNENWLRKLFKLKTQ